MYLAAADHEERGLPGFGGILLSCGLGVAWNFYAFAIPAALGVGVVLLLPGRLRAHAKDAPARVPS